jgi:ribosomal protein L40E
MPNYCFNCGSRLRPEDTICKKCLVSVYSVAPEEVCEKCGSFYPREANFCPVCGKEVRMEEEEVVEEEEGIKKPVHVPAKAIFFILILLVVSSFGYILYKTPTCSIIVGESVRGDAEIFWKAVDILKDKAPYQYDMLCRYVDRVNFYGSRWVPPSAGGLYPHGTKVIHLYSQYGKIHGKDQEKLFAGLVAHETCHSMMSEIRGGLGMLTAAEIENPCEIQNYFVLYKTGYYDNYTDPYERMLYELNHRGLAYVGHGVDTYDIPNDYCKGAKISAEKRDGTLEVKNTGLNLVNCALIHLKIDGVTHPLECGDLQPGESAVLTSEYFKNAVSLKIFGCPEIIRL